MKISQEYNLRPEYFVNVSVILSHWIYKLGYCEKVIKIKAGPEVKNEDWVFILKLDTNLYIRLNLCPILSNIRDNKNLAAMKVNGSNWLIVQNISKYLFKRPLPTNYGK